MAAGCLHVMNLDDAVLRRELLSYPRPCFVNLGCGEDISIAELAALIAEVTGFKGRLTFDTTKPDGTPRKLLDVSRLKQLGWQPKIDLATGLAATYRWFLENQTQLRGVEDEEKTLVG